MAGEHSIGVVEDLGSWMRQMERRMQIQERRPTGESFIGGSYVDELEDHNPYTSTLDEVLGITATNVTDVMIESPLVQALVVNTVVLNAGTIFADEAWIDAVNAVVVTADTLQTSADPTTGIKIGDDFDGFEAYDGTDVVTSINRFTGKLTTIDADILGIFRTSNDPDEARVEIKDGFNEYLGETWSQVNLYPGDSAWAPAQLFAKINDGIYGGVRLSAPTLVGDEGSAAALNLDTDLSGTPRALILADQISMVAHSYYFGDLGLSSVDFRAVGTSLFQMFSNVADDTGYLNFNLALSDRHTIGAWDAGDVLKDMRLLAAKVIVDAGLSVTGGVVTLDTLADGGASNSNSGAKFCRVGVDGRLYSSDTAPSSLAIKHDIHPLNLSDEALLALTPVTYRYNEAPDKVRVGVIAEEADSLGLGPLVGCEDREHPTKPTGFDYVGLSAALLGVVSRQAAKITDLTERVSNLEGTP